MLGGATSTSPVADLVPLDDMAPMDDMAPVDAMAPVDGLATVAVGTGESDPLGRLQLLPAGLPSGLSGRFEPARTGECEGLRTRLAAALGRPAGTRWRGMAAVGGMAGMALACSLPADPLMAGIGGFTSSSSFTASNSPMTSASEPPP